MRMRFAQCFGEHTQLGYDTAESFIGDRDFALTSDEIAQFFTELTGEKITKEQMAAAKPDSARQIRAWRDEAVRR